MANRCFYTVIYDIRNKCLELHVSHLKKDVLGLNALSKRVCGKTQEQFEEIANDWKHEMEDRYGNKEIIPCPQGMTLIA